MTASDKHSEETLAIAELQNRIAFQEDTLNQLNTVIAQQDASIGQLQKQMQILNKKLNDVASSVDHGGASGGDEPPPHY